jgi:hypothetical protein
VHTFQSHRAPPALRILRLEAIVASCGERRSCTLADTLKEFLALRLRDQQPIILARPLFHWLNSGQHTALSSSETRWFVGPDAVGPSREGYHTPIMLQGPVITWVVAASYCRLIVHPSFSRCEAELTAWHNHLHYHTLHTLDPRNF